MSTVLERPAVKQAGLFIDGKDVPSVSGETFDVLNPTDNTLLAQVAKATKEDVDRAVAAAQRAYEGPWGRMKTADRSAILSRVAQRIVERAGELATLESRDVGKPLKESRVEMPRASLNFRFFAELITKLNNESAPVDNDFLNYHQRRPLGVAGLITPWNFPFMLTTWKAGPCLAAGNTCVIKPASVTPMTPLLLGEICAEAGVPEGVLNVVPGPGPIVGQRFAENPDIKLISFTGETVTGQSIMTTASKTLKRLSFELGGKSANIVFGDASWEEALAGSIRAIYANQGEVCLAGSRLLVEDSIYDKFVADFIDRAGKLKIGDPLDDTTDLGPLVSAEHLARVKGYLDIAESEGARVVAGGKTPKGWEQGNFLEPTVIVDVDNKMRCAQEEIFGPVVTVIRFKGEEEAIRLANDSRYGLAGVVWTNDLRRAHRVAQSIDGGTIWVNCWFVRDLRVPFGGMKESGIGREGGHWSLDFYTEQKNICIKLT
ncbi:MAG TPA: aldehyde dehydrogenase [Chloroflexota bacterium]|nr:aldehyde dehydrogenase [Chloroflexota bacterium]